MVKKLFLAIVLPGLATNSALGSDEPRPEEIRWLEENAVPFATAEAGQGFEDLEPLRRIIGNARIVALGEGTHGTREYFKMKHRLTEFLASEMGFTIFSIEASTPEAYEVSDYVVRGSGDPKRLIGGMYFWTWNTEEVLDMVEWMREFNESGRGEIEFTGFDMQTPDVAMQIVTDFLDDADPEMGKRVSEEYEQIKDAQRKAGFGVATFTFPIEHARGKRVRFSGVIKTEDLKEGWAGLWWRVDGEDRTVLAFDNMMARGPRGTTDWKEYTVELHVPEEAVNINFGVLMPGQGKAWFDNLAISLDGEPYEETDFDLGFEGKRVKGYASSGQGYMASMDSKNGFSGNQSLRLESEERDPDGMEAKKAAEISGRILDELRASRDRFLEGRDAREVDWVIHNARIVDQGMRASAGSVGRIRDESMAENVAWIMEQNPGSKIVLWAHNGHISRREGAMGSHLARTFGKDYLPVAFAAGTGKYYAMGPPGDHELQPPPDGSVESYFAATGEPRLLLDLRRANPGSKDAAWLTKARPFRSIGAMAMEEQFYPMTVTDEFDVLIYFDETTPARQLDTRPGRSRSK